MKKYLITCLLCVLCFGTILCGCSPVKPLENAPTTTAQTSVYGSALTYDNYIYFANSYQNVDDLEKGDNKNNAENPALYRIALTDNQITKDEDGLPTLQEKVLAKIAGYSNGFMFSSGEYIYFASPNTHLDDSLSTLFDYNSYFRVKTDGTGLTEFYSSNTTVSQQTFFKITDEEQYLLLVDVDRDGNNKLVKIAIGENIGSAETVVSGFTNIVFAKNYTNENDIYAYYTTELSEQDTTYGKTGQYLNKVNILTTEKTEKINENQTSEITLKEVYNGNLYFVFAEKNQQVNMNSVFAKLNNTSAFSFEELTAPLSNITSYTDFRIVLDEANHLHYVLTVNSKTYCLPENDKNMANYLLMENATILFAYSDYIYYTTTEGIYRINVRDFSDNTQISELTSLKTDTISFDGKYIYYYANDDYSSETYYLFRSRVNIPTNHELLSVLLDEDMPTEENEEETAE